MSAAKHTPGPWEVRASKDTVDFGIIVRDPRADGGWAVIAETFSEVRHAGERAPEALPNARLIAAAPRLFDALETLADALTTGAGRDFIEAFVRDAKAALEEAAPGWNMLAEPSRQKLREQANVRAAAPELLEAARAFVAPFDGVEMVEGSAVALARAAIAKATGGASHG